jgi:hypothetical protein
MVDKSKYLYIYGRAEINYDNQKINYDNFHTNINDTELENIIYDRVVPTTWHLTKTIHGGKIGSNPIEIENTFIKARKILPDRTYVEICVELGEYLTDDLWKFFVKIPYEIKMKILRELKLC